MQIIRTIAEIHLNLAKERIAGKSIALVPTMGALHFGHLSLIDEAKKVADIVVVSIFVNKKQFNNANDYLKYPKNLETDIEKLQAVGVTYLFAPDEDEIYQPDCSFKILPDHNLLNCLCGGTRVGHMEGVCLIVTKLFNIVKPDIAIFGEKDFQQLQIIRKLVKDLSFNIEIIGCKTSRNEDGLPLSSRNSLLTKEQLKQAANLTKVLLSIKNQLQNLPDQDLEKLLEQKKRELLDLGFEKIDYLEIRNENNLKLTNQITQNQPLRIFIAAFISDIRLIDNLSLNT